MLLMSRHLTETLPALDWTGWGTRYLFFTGKGGVGKTTTASAVAVALADAGLRTLVISTDPASNLDDVFGIDAGPQPTAVPGVPGLFISNLDPEAAAKAFKERAVGPYRGVLPLTMGKGGVGKTTLAAAIAIALVDRGHEVTLSTTDPAAHITDALAEAAPDGLLVERIEPAVETARYTEEVLAAAAGLDEEGLALLEEDLRSPCTEEIAVFRAFARTVDAACERIVVLDTAPTGHTLLLLDAAQSYQREVQRTNANVPIEVSELLARLRDPGFARMLVITHAESTPVQEAERLQEDLRRAGIEPFGWVINASLMAAGTTHPTLRARAAAELTHIDRARRASAATSAADKSSTSMAKHVNRRSGRRPPSSSPQGGLPSWRDSPRRCDRNRARQLSLHAAHELAAGNDANYAASLTALRVRSCSITTGRPICNSSPLHVPPSASVGLSG